MRIQGRTKRRLLAAALTAAAVFSLFSLARESLVPFSADYDRAKWRLTGDEPAYLLTAQALASGHGEDVSAVHRAQTYTNYQRKVVIGSWQWTFDDYAQRCKVRFLLDRRSRWTTRDGTPRQILHGGPLEPLIAAPFALSPDRPRWKILCWQGLLSSLAIGLAVFLAPRGGDTRLQAFACAAVCGSAPVVFYSAQIFPEMAIGCLLLLSLMLARDGGAPRRMAGYACLFLSLWGSSRVVGAVAAAAICWIAAAARKRRHADIAAIVALFAAYFGYHLWQWGNFFPPNTDLASPITPALLPRGFARYWAGNATGLLLLQPVSWAGIVALALLLRRPGDDTAIAPCAALAIGIPLSVAMFPAWRAGTCPAGRYQVAEALVLIAPLLLYFGRRDESPWRGRMVFLLLALGAVSLALGIWLSFHPGAWWERYHPFFKPLSLQPYYRFLPDFDGRWRKPLAALAALLCGATFMPDIFRFGRGRSGPPLLRPFRHLAWVPFLVAGQFILEPFCKPLSGLLVPLGGTLMAALCLEDLLRAPLARGDATPERHGMRAASMLFLVTASLLLALYYGFAKGMRYRGGGDVRHYRLLVSNLEERGDLDITDRIEALMDEDGVMDEARRAAYIRRSHTRRNSRGRIYSVHSFGFPLLVWPFRETFGDFGDVLALALIGAMSLVGVRASCLSHGAGRAAANVVTALTGLSCAWIYDALAFLPEMLGFGLCAWAFWAIPAQHEPRRRLAATLVSAVACAYMPYAHVRFTPLAMCLAGFFSLEGLLVAREPFSRRKFPRLCAYALVCLAAWAGIWLCHRAMFAGTATYNFSGIAGRTPIAAWGMFTDRRGLVAAFPPLCAYLAATIAEALRGGPGGRHAAMALVSLGSVLYFCCCITAALGGTCLNGRYLYNAMPLLIPFFAIAFQRADRPGRVWMLFLSLMPVLYFVFISFRLSGGKLLRTPEPMRRFREYRNFWEPFPSFYRSPTPSTARTGIAIGSAFSASIIAVSFLACIRRRPRARAIAAAILLAFALAAGLFVNYLQPPRRWTPPPIPDGGHAAQEAGAHGQTTLKPAQ